MSPYGKEGDIDTQGIKTEPHDARDPGRPNDGPRRSEQFFCIKHTRIVTRDNTIPFDGHRLQIPPGPQRRSYAQARVDVWQHHRGCLEVRYQGESLVRFRPATDAPLRVGKFTPAPGQTWSKPPATPKAKLHTPHRPADDHPWRQYGQSLKGRKLG